MPLRALLRMYPELWLPTATGWVLQTMRLPMPVCALVRMKL
jgi:hypothetical protein